LQVVDATGNYLNRLGLDANFFATTDYAITQQWASALMIHPRAPAGIRYNSRKNPRRVNYALFGSPGAKSAVRLVKEEDRDLFIQVLPDIHRAVGTV
jgi:hypothetical protein